MSRFLAIPALALILLPSTTFAQFGGMGGMGGGRGGPRMLGGPEPSWPAQRWLVKVETLAGKSVSGTLTLAGVPIDCDLGRYYIKAENVKSVRFTMPNEHAMVMGPGAAIQVQGAVAPREGEEIDGSLVINNWTVETDLGQLTLYPSKLKSVTFLKKVESPRTTAEPVKAEVKEQAEKK